MKPQENQTQQSFEQQNLFGMGSENKAYAAFFTGNSYLNPLTQPACGLSLANVTFEPGCRNHWHIHHASSGDGWYQEEGKPAVSLRPGMVVTIPANVKHWHGAQKKQLVRAHRGRNPRRKQPHRMVRTGAGRRV